ncbi:MAG: GNAT family N-acetyltransferase [Chloroflexi bacterium]|nr:GNAT family N-acetyltransferase [Chloroflexota bacterium]
MNQSITIGECTLEECVSVLGLWSEAGSANSVTDTVEVLGRLVKDSGDLFLVAREDDKVIGSIIGGWDGWRGHIYRLAVLPGYRRLRVAERLTKELEGRLAAKGAVRIFALVEMEKPHGVGFWNSSAADGYGHAQGVGLYVKDAG